MAGLGDNNRTSTGDASIGERTKCGNVVNLSSPSSPISQDLKKKITFR